MIQSVIIDECCNSQSIVIGNTLGKNDWDETKIGISEKRSSSPSEMLIIHFATSIGSVVDHVTDSKNLWCYFCWVAILCTRMNKRSKHVVIVPSVAGNTRNLLHSFNICSLSSWESIPLHSGNILNKIDNPSSLKTHLLCESANPHSCCKKSDSLLVSYKATSQINFWDFFPTWRTAKTFMDN